MLQVRSGSNERAENGTLYDKVIRILEALEALNFSSRSLIFDPCGRSPKQMAAWPSECMPHS
jgi:hypothetical protein